MTKRTLFNISEDILALENLLIENDGEIGNDAVEAAIDSWFAELGDARNSKLESYAYLIRAISEDAAAIKNEVDRLKARQKAMENRATHLQQRLENFFRVHNLDRIETTNFTFAMQKSGGKPKVLLNEYFAENPVELPEGLRRVKFEADLIAIRERLEANDPSVADIASLEESQPKLRIK